jgi:adenylate cyclase
MNVVASYLPQDRRQALATDLDLPSRAVGAALLADISGFTALTEALTQQLGPRRGIEVLTAKINTVYDVLIAHVDAYRGSVIGFAGDAITCWFSDSTDAGIPGASPRAVACALALQADMRAFQSILLPDGGSIGLGLKVAVASGPARRFVVGDANIQLMDALVGSTVARTASAEHQAHRGEVLVDQPTVEALGKSLIISEWRGDENGRDRFAVVGGLSAKVAATPWPELIASLPEARVRPWLHPAVYIRERSGLGEFLNELRPVVSVFVRFGGIDYDNDDAAGDKLNNLVQQLQVIINELSGSLIQLTIGDKGSYMYCVFGTPVAHEDDAQRAVRAALALHGAAERAGLPALQIGLSSGTMLCGAYGAAVRKNYGALGDEVNLAARLMQLAAPGETLVSGRIQRVLGDAFVLDPRSPVRLKGKAEPVPVFAVREATRRRAFRLEEPVAVLPMVGREDALAQVAAVFERVRTGQGQVLGIVAEAGMGKSRLVAEIIRLVTRAGWTGYGGTCHAFGTRNPYLVWQTIWRAFFDIDPSAPPGRQLRALTRLVDELAPERLQALPLLDSLLGIDIAQNDFTQALEPRFRQSTLHALLHACLRTVAVEAQADGKGLLLVLEDLHWIDDASLNLLTEVAQAVSDLPVLIVLAYRPSGQMSAELNKRIEVLPHYVSIALTALDDEATQLLIRAKLAQLFPAHRAAVPDALIRHLSAHAQGNPFYLEELLNYLRDQGITPADQTVPVSMELPTSLRALILSRIDQLSAHEQATLKLASVIGRMFRFAWLHGAFPVLGESTALRADLEQLANLDLTPIDPSESELSFLFKSILTQEVPYESLPADTRARLHGQLAGYVEALAGDDTGRFVEFLAFHYERSGNLAKKREYLQRAGDKAAASFAHNEAIDLYSRAINLAPDSDHDARYTLLLAREQEYGLLGARAAQAKDIDTLQALALRTNNTLRQAEVALRRAAFALATGRNHDALIAAEQSAMLAAQAGDIKAEAQAQHRWGRAFWQAGEYAPAREHLDEALRLARICGSAPDEANCLYDLATVSYYQDDDQTALTHLQQSTALFERLGNKEGEIRCLSLNGVVLDDIGSRVQAMERFERALNTCNLVGWRYGEARLLQQSGDCMLGLGMLDASQERFERAARICREIDDQQNLANILDGLGMIACHRNALPQARQLFADALAIHQAMDNRRGQGYALTHLGHVLMRLRDWAAAADVLRQAHDIRRESAAGGLLLDTLSAQALLALMRGDWHGALPSVQEVLGYLDTHSPKGAESPAQVYLIAYLVVHRKALEAPDQREAAVRLLAAGHALLDQQSQTILDEALRAQFVRSIPANRQLTALWRAQLNRSPASTAAGNNPIR